MGSVFDVTGGLTACPVTAALAAFGLVDSVDYHIAKEKNANRNMEH